MPQLKKLVKVSLDRDSRHMMVGTAYSNNIFTKLPRASALTIPMVLDMQTGAVNNTTNC